MKVSVVIPVFNEAEVLRSLPREVDRALSAYERYEIVVVDDGSTDATAEQVKGVTYRWGSCSATSAPVQRGPERGTGYGGAGRLERPLAELDREEAERPGRQVIPAVR